MTTTTRKIREMSVIVDTDIPEGCTLAEYRASRTVAEVAGAGATAPRMLARLRRRRSQQARSAA